MRVSPARTPPPLQERPHTKLRTSLLICLLACLTAQQAAAVRLARAERRKAWSCIQDARTVNRIAMSTQLATRIPVSNARSSPESPASRAVDHLEHAHRMCAGRHVYRAVPPAGHDRHAGLKDLR